MNFKKAVFITISILAIMAFSFPPKKKIKIWLCGDSTMAIKETKAYPETGWGMPFVWFFDSTVTVENKAKNGRSTKTFITENIWQSVMDNAAEGDYVFIQFGHNDEVKEKVKTYTTPEEYKANLTRFVTEARAKNAIPVLLTPVTRRGFDSAGQVKETHTYSGYVREVAAEQKVLLIDMDETSKALLQQFGKEYSKLLYLQLKPGEHPNYPDGKEDNTHFNELGARLMAQLVLQDIRKLIPDLAERVVKPLPALKK